MCLTSLTLSGSQVVKGGKIMGFRCVAIVGNQAGLVGVGCQVRARAAATAKTCRCIQCHACTDPTLHTRALTHTHTTHSLTHSQAGREIAVATKRALVDAKKNVVRVPLVGAGTIPHRSEAKFHAGRCVLVPASDGE